MRDRFLFIHRNLRAFETSVYAQCPANFKMWRLLDTFNREMREAWNPTMFVSLDDHLVAIKGSIGIVMYRNLCMDATTG